VPVSSEESERRGVVIATWGHSKPSNSQKLQKEKCMSMKRKIEQLTK
jgi:hypothetical protein